MGTMEHQVDVDAASLADELFKDHMREVRIDLAYKRLAIVNCVFFGKQGAKEWVLIDAGIKGAAWAIKRAAKERFGSEAPPTAIILTHAHFDHVGALRDLLKNWDVPVYAHSLEHPYFTGDAAYPPPDPSVGGGLMSLKSPMFPRGPIEIREHLDLLPEDGSVPGMRGWQWIHTPGHSPGHISLWRKRDRTLIAGDAFITTAQESAYAVLTQEPEIHGPPMYYTLNWREAEQSVRALADLSPDLAVTGHGRAMQGPDFLDGLRILADRFQEIAVPDQGRYVDEPLDAERERHTW